MAIDSYCLLHKGAIGCADKLIRKEPTDMHIQYCLKYVNLLLTNNVKPILVFDGRHLPAKAMTESRRRESRQSAKVKAKELLREGKTNEARSFLNRCVDITHEMALQLIQECHKRNVDCIVAPYEADAQLAFLNRNGFADYIITEDSDLILFKCNKIIFKFDLTGQGLLFESELLYLTMGCRAEKYSFDKFLMMCILSGCDYLDSLKGIGLAKACKFVLLTEETDVKRCLTKLPSYLNLRGVSVEVEYKESFVKALATFKHMVVYDPRKRKQCRLTEPSKDELEFCTNAGTELDDGIAFQLALGNLNPFTLKKLDNWSPDELNTDKFSSIWLGSSKKPTQQKTLSQFIKPRILKSTNFDEHKVNSEDIMNMYLKPEDQSPELKRPRLEEHSMVIEASQVISPRNPFLKQKRTISDSDLGQAPLSLLQKVSPVKKIDSPFNRPKLSKFTRANSFKNDANVLVVSKFFSKTQKDQGFSEENGDENKLTTTDEVFDDLINVMDENPIDLDADGEQGWDDLFKEKLSSQERDEKTPESSTRIEVTPDIYMVDSESISETGSQNEKCEKDQLDFDNSALTTTNNKNQELESEDHLDSDNLVISSTNKTQEPESVSSEGESGNLLRNSEEQNLITFGVLNSNSEKSGQVMSESSQKENEIIILSETDSPLKSSPPKKQPVMKKRSFQSKLSAFGFQKK